MQSNMTTAKLLYVQEQEVMQVHTYIPSPVAAH